MISRKFKIIPYKHHESNLFNEWNIRTFFEEILSFSNCRWFLTWLGNYITYQCIKNCIKQFTVTNFNCTRQKLMLITINETYLLKVRLKFYSFFNWCKKFCYQVICYVVFVAINIVVCIFSDKIIYYGSQTFGFILLNIRKERI